MGGRGGGSGGNSGNSRDEKTAKALNPNATPEQVKQFTKSMQAIREKQAAQTAAITQEAQKAVGVIVEDSTRYFIYDRL